MKSAHDPQNQPPKTMVPIWWSPILVRLAGPIPADDNSLRRSDRARPEICRLVTSRKCLIMSPSPGFPIKAESAIIRDHFEKTWARPA